MKLSYRGLNYNNDDPPSIDMIEDSGGLYRGCQWQVRYPRHVPVTQPSHSLKYRGLAYVSHNPTETKVVEATPATVPTVVTTVKKTGALSNRKHDQRDTATILQDMEKIHQANICRSLERRMNIAQAKGDQKLMVLLQQECQDLACALF
jgi:hypothetical protein